MIKVLKLIKTLAFDFNGKCIRSPTIISKHFSLHRLLNQYFSQKYSMSKSFHQSSSSSSLSSSKRAVNTGSFDSLSLSLSLSLSRHPSCKLSLLESSLDGIRCPHRADRCKFLLVNRVGESTEERCLWVHPYYFGSAQACLVRLLR